MLTNADFFSTTSQGISLTPQNKTIETGVDVNFILRVSNSGSPTTLWDYKAFIILPGVDAKEMDASIPSVLVPTNQVMPTIVGLFKMTKENFLLDALSSTPMQTGAAGNYWLDVHVNGLKEIPVGTHFVIKFTDVSGREIKVDYAWIPNL